MRYPKSCHLNRGACTTGLLCVFLSSALGLEKPLSPNEVERVGLLL